jgi:cytochrome c oxidase subunit IV
MTDPHPDSHPAPSPTAEKQFHGWRLISVIMGVIALLALVSAAVDWFALG